MKKTNIIFMGTPDFAVPILKTLIENYNVTLVVTQPDKLVGRHKELKYSPVKELALENNIEVFQPTNIKTDYDPIISKAPDLIVTCAYGQIIPKVLLDLPKIAAINVHASLLPKLRGGAPIHRALINGDKYTGITIMYMDEAMDSGDIISTKQYEIEDNDNVGILHDKLSALGAKLLEETLPSIISGTNVRLKQDPNEVTYAYTIKREDEHIKFNDTSLNIVNKVRGLNPWPMANALLNDEEIKILTCNMVNTDSKLSAGTIVSLTKDSIIVKTADGAVSITELKPFGKRKMTAKEYLNGIDKNKILYKIMG